MMLYMIGGPPRMGKSSLAQYALKEHGIPYVSTDGLTVMLKPIGQPSFYSPEKANSFYPYLDLFIDRILKTARDYVIEGDAFSPKHIKQLKEKYDIKCVFLIMTHVNPKLIVGKAKYDKWTDDISYDQLKHLCSRIETASKDIKRQCEQTSIKYYDMSNSYDEQFRKAGQYIVS